MAQDRDLYIETFSNVSNFQKEGLPVDARWNSSAAYNHWSGWWLDPKSKDFGPNAQYFQHNLAEAKKLLAAAGHPNGFEVSATYAPAPASPAQRNFDVLAGFAIEAGMKLTYNLVQNPTPWRPNYYFARGNWDGMGFITIRGAGDTGVAFNSYYHPTGGIFPGFDPDGKSTYAGDPFLTQLVEKINSEFDQQKRYGLAHELQRYDAKKQYFPRSRRRNRLHSASLPSRTTGSSTRSKTAAAPARTRRCSGWTRLPPLRGHLDFWQGSAKSVYVYTPSRNHVRAFNPQRLEPNILLPVRRVLRHGLLGVHAGGDQCSDAPSGSPG
jgi:hypothetical protein